MSLDVHSGCHLPGIAFGSLWFAGVFDFATPLHRGKMPFYWQSKGMSWLLLLFTTQVYSWNIHMVLGVNKVTMTFVWVSLSWIPLSLCWQLFQVSWLWTVLCRYADNYFRCHDCELFFVTMMIVVLGVIIVNYPLSLWWPLFKCYLLWRLVFFLGS